MISPVSFLGTYKVNNQNPEKFSKFQKYALDKELEDGVKTSLKDEIIPKGDFLNFDYRAEQTLIVPDYMDYDVETFCANNGIKYKKYDTKDILNPNSVMSRIAEAPQGYKTVKINAKKLEELAEKQNSNLDYCKYDYEEYYMDKIDTMLRNCKKIPATTLVINNLSGNEDLKDYINNYGIEYLHNGQLLTCFNQKTDNPDHCIYFALKDMGVEDIPVYVDKESYEAGRLLGLFC